jgi:ribosomal protein L37AE/L43A
VPFYGILLANLRNIIQKKETKMKCPKCEGLMYLERLSDFFIIFHAWKCINCGALMDKTILDNQKKSLPFLEPVGSTKNDEG